MTLGRALAYFFREATVSLVRSWKVSALAILTIAVSLLIGGTFLLLSANLSRVVERWEQEARLVLYLTPQTADAARTALRASRESDPDEANHAETDARVKEALDSARAALRGGAADRW